MIRGVRLFKKPLPLTCLLIICTIIANYCYEEIVKNRIIGTELSNDPPKIVNEGQYWRLCTSFLTHNSLSSLFLSIYLILVEGGAFENLIGSITYLLLFIIKGLLLSISYIIWYYAIQSFFDLNVNSFNPIAEGAWMVILSDLISRTITNPNEQRICRTIPNKIYVIPIIIAGFIVSYVGVQLLAIFSLALIENKCFNGLIFRPYRSHILCVENYTPIILFKKCMKFSFVGVEECKQVYFRIEGTNKFLTNRQDSENDIEDEEQNNVKCQNNQLKGTQSRAQEVSKQKKVNVEDSFYENSNYSGKLAISESYYSQNIKKWRNADDRDENIAEDAEDPQQHREDIEMSSREQEQEQEEEKEIQQEED